MANGSIFNLPEFKRYRAPFMARASKFATYRGFVDGSIYRNSQFRMMHKLYAETKALFSFLARAVDLDVALVPGVMGPWALKEGTPQAILDAQAQLYQWSEWPVESDEWLEDGASLGEAMLEIIVSEDDSGSAIVKLDTVCPEHCMLVEDHMDLTDQERVQMALYVDASQVDDEGTQYEYARVITPGEIRLYKDGNPFDYNGDGDRYANPLGFVPIICTENDSECRPTFSKTIEQITSVNEFASYLGETIARAIDAQWAISGAEQSDLEKSGHNVWFLPMDAKVQAIVAQLDIPGALAFIQEVKTETKSNLPELAFDDLRAKAQIATETLEVQLVELDAKIWKMRRRYDAGLIKAHQMAALAAQVSGVSGLEALLQPHQMDYKRPVRPISEMEQIALENARMGRDMQRTLMSGDGMTNAQMRQGQQNDKPVDTAGGNDGNTN